MSVKIWIYENTTVILYLTDLIKVRTGKSRKGMCIYSVLVGDRKQGAENRWQWYCKVAVGWETALLLIFV